MILPWEYIPDPCNPFNDLNPHRSMKGARKIWAENMRMHEEWEAKKKELATERDKRRKRNA